MIRTQYRKYTREYQVRYHHLVSGKATNFFCSQDQAEDISRLHREGYDIGNYYNFLSRIILAIGGRIHMPHRIIEVGVEFIIGHMQM